MRGHNIQYTYYSQLNKVTYTAGEVTKRCDNAVVGKRMNIRNETHFHIQNANSTWHRRFQTTDVEKPSPNISLARFTIKDNFRYNIISEGVISRYINTKLFQEKFRQ